MKVNREAASEVRKALKEAAEPVRMAAEQLAVSSIRNVGPTWSRVRVGTRTGSVYIAPQARRRRGSPRPNLGKLLLEEALWPAAKAGEADMVRQVERALDQLGRSAGF